MWADALHYYGKDLWEMDGASAMKLAYRVHDVVAVNASVDPPQFMSSVYRRHREANEQDTPTTTGQMTMAQAAAAARARSEGHSTLPGAGSCGDAELNALAALDRDVTGSPAVEIVEVS